MQSSRQEADYVIFLTATSERQLRGTCSRPGTPNEGSSRFAAATFGDAKLGSTNGLLCTGYLLRGNKEIPMAQTSGRPGKNSLPDLCKAKERFRGHSTTP